MKQVPIVASREKPFGLYIASDEEQFSKGIAAFENQSKTMQKNAEQLRNTHLNLEDAKQSARDYFSDKQWDKIQKSI